MFNKETEYAIRALVYIQHQNMSGRRPGIMEITQEIEAPQFFTAKILQRLVRQGFMQSIKGKGGGFYFEQEKPEVTLRDLVFATEGTNTFSDCGFGLKHCNETNPCPLHNRYVPIRDAYNRLIREETIQSLARKSQQKKPDVKPEK